MKKKPRLLVVDDEPSLRRILQVAFEKSGYTVYTAEDAQAAEALLASQAIDAVLTDVTMPGKSGQELLSAIKARTPELPVILMTAYGTIPQAVKAIQEGAFEYLPKPFDLDSLKKIVARALDAREGTRPSRKKRAAAEPGASPEFIAHAPAMREILDVARQVASTRANVLITGESGTGKEVVAKTLHALSERADKPFVAVSCAALPETLLESELFGHEKGAFTGADQAKIGRFEAADGGTLFLDEIGEIPLGMQVKLLRVLQEREFERLGASRPTRVDVRLVAATNRDLAVAVQEGVFRLDLMYRLQVIQIELPPLRERREDVLPLANHFLTRYGAENGRAALPLSVEAEEALLRYPWPGNVRELENMMERAMVLAPREAIEVGASLLPRGLQKVA